MKFKLFNTIILFILFFNTAYAEEKEQLITPMSSGRFKVSYDMRDETDVFAVATYSAAFRKWANMSDDTNAKIVRKHRVSPACVVDSLDNNKFQIYRLKWTEDYHVAVKGKDLGVINASADKLNTTKQTTYNFYCGSIEDSGKITIEGRGKQ